MTIKQIVLGGFLVVNLLIVALIGFNYKSTHIAKSGFEEIAKTNDIAQDIATIQEHLLKGIGYINFYFAKNNPKDLKRYQDVYSIALKHIAIVISEVKQNSYLKATLVNFKDIKSDLYNLNALLMQSKKDFDKIGNLEDKLLKNIEMLQDQVASIQDKISKDSITRLDSYTMIVSVFSIIAIVLGIVLAFIITSFITKNLKTVQDAAHDLASSDGDLTKRLPVIGKNEIGVMANEVNRFIGKVHHTIKESKINGEENSSVAIELSATALEIGHRAENEARLVNETTTIGENAFEELQSIVETIEANDEVVTNASKSLNIANTDIRELLEVIDITGQKELDLAQNISQLQEEANNVKDVLDLIADIADQTNLLALNAAIEAARAGEHGRGFAVVADEVRMLAEKTQKSLAEITSTINLVIQSVDQVSTEMQDNSKAFEEAINKAKTIDTHLDTVEDALNKADDISSTSAKRSLDMKEKMSEVINKMKDIRDISTANARSVEEVAGAAEHLSNLTGELKATLDEFKS